MLGEKRIDTSKKLARHVRLLNEYGNVTVKKFDILCFFPPDEETGEG
jgi:hypothetical protein